MNEPTWLEKLRQTTLTGEQQQQLFKKIGILLKNAIEDRAPRNRPAGKAGLRAEKGYYRLLYLEGDFSEKATFHEQADHDALSAGWDQLAVILGQLTDLPEIRSEIQAGIASAVDEIVSHPPTED